MKPELEFFDPEKIPWQSLGGGLHQKVLAGEESGNYTRLLRFDPGTVTGETLKHEFWEEVWILEGTMIDLGKRQTFTAGMYACRPPGMVHGPYRVPAGGCLTFEIRYSGRR